MKPADDIPGVGRFAILMDPQGAAFAIIKTRTTRIISLPIANCRLPIGFWIANKLAIGNRQMKDESTSCLA